MLPRDGVASRQDLRLDRSGHVHQIHAPAARIRRSRSRIRMRFFTGPTAEDFLGGFQHFIRIEIADEQQNRIFRRVKFAVDRLQILALVRGHLRLTRRNLGIRMRAKQNFAQSLACEEFRLRALQLYFFQLLPPFAFEFGFRKRRFARQLVYQSEQRLREFRESGKRNRAGIRPRAGRKIRADAPQILLDLAAGALGCSRASHRRGHFRKPRSAINRRRISRAEKQFAMKLWNRMSLRENDFKAIRKPRPGPLRPSHRAFRRESGNAVCHFHSAGGHYAASFALALRGVRKMMARFSFRRYFLATA